MVAEWRLTGDCMVAEWRLFGDGKGGLQSHLSIHLVIIQSAEWWAHFSDLSINLRFWKKNYTQRGSNREIRNKGKVR